MVPLPQLAFLFAAPTILAMGETLPPLQGEFLTGNKATLPAAAKGRVALLALGFTYDSRWAVEAWIKSWNAQFKSDPRATFFEVPMLGGAARMGKWFIDSGMRKGTPKENHENVITVYGGTQPWKDRLAFTSANKDHAYLILLDSAGVVKWTHHGPLDPAQFDQLARTARDLLPSDRVPK